MSILVGQFDPIPRFHYNVNGTVQYNNITIFSDGKFRFTSEDENWLQVEMVALMLGVEIVERRVALSPKNKKQQPN